MPLIILTQKNTYTNQQCQLWTQTFRIRKFLDVKRMNNYFLKTQKTLSLSTVNKLSDLH